MQLQEISYRAGKQLVCVLERTSHGQQLGNGGSGMVALDGRTEALVGDMGAGNEVEAGSGKFWWRAEMFWRQGGGAAYREMRSVLLTLTATKGATAVH